MATPAQGLCIQYSVPLKLPARRSKYILHAPLQPLEDLDAPMHPLPGNYIDLFARYDISMKRSAMRMHSHGAGNYIDLFAG